MTSLHRKSSLEEIKARFDDDVERFSNLGIGQSTTLDATLAMELIAQAACQTTKSIHNVLDIGCGAGNHTVKLAQQKAHFNVDLIDLSLPMLERAKQRVQAVTSGEVITIQGDFRTIALTDEKYDVIIAAAVLHHLRDDVDWENAFQKIYNLCAPAGSVWISDLITHSNTHIQAMMWQRYGDYLTSLKGQAYQQEVFAYIDILIRKIRQDHLPIS